MVTWFRGMHPQGQTKSPGGYETDSEAGTGEFAEITQTGEDFGYEDMLRQMIDDYGFLDKRSSLPWETGDTSGDFKPDYLGASCNFTSAPGIPNPTKEPVNFAMRDENLTDDAFTWDSYHRGDTDAIRFGVVPYVSFEDMEGLVVSPSRYKETESLLEEEVGGDIAGKVDMWPHREDSDSKLQYTWKVREYLIENYFPSLAEKEF